MFNQNVHKMFDYRKTQELTCMIFLCILFAGCNDKKTSGEGNLSNEGLTEVYIDMDNDEDALPFDSLFELTSVVKLETTDDNLVGDIFDILPLRDKLVVEDMEISQSVTVYDMNGKYLNRIGTFGQGPEEYSFLEYVSADSTAGIVRISDIGGQKVMSFDENGKFLNSIPMPFFAYRCEPLTDDVVVSHLDEGIALDGKPRLVISDLQKNVRYSGFPTDLHGDYNLVSLHALRRYGDKVFFVPAYREQDTIYQVTPDGVLPYYYLNIKRNGNIKEEDKNNVDKFNEKLESLSAYFIGDFIELKDYAIFGLSEPRSSWQRFAVYSKAKKKCYYCTGNYFDGRLRFALNPRFPYRDDVFVTYAQAIEVMKFKDEIYRLCKKEDAEALFDGLTEDSNPILFFYRVKI